jgi:hypothetical protein
MPALGGRAGAAGGDGSRWAGSLRPRRRPLRASRRVQFQQPMSLCAIPHHAARRRPRRSRRGAPRVRGRRARVRQDDAHQPRARAGQGRPGGGWGQRPRARVGCCRHARPTGHEPARARRRRPRRRPLRRPSPTRTRATRAAHPRPAARAWRTFGSSAAPRPRARRSTACSWRRSRWVAEGLRSQKHTPPATSVRPIQPPPPQTQRPPTQVASAAVVLCLDLGDPAAALASAAAWLGVMRGRLARACDALERAAPGLPEQLRRRMALRLGTGAHEDGAGVDVVGTAAVSPRRGATWPPPGRREEVLQGPESTPPP